MPAAGAVCKGTPLGVTKALGMQEETGHRLVLTLMQSEEAGKAEGGPAVYCRICGKYTMRNCRGLKEKCPGNTETRRAWLLRLGKEKKHPTNVGMAVTHEWDVSSLKAGWESEHHAKEEDGLVRIMQTVEPCNIDAVEPTEDGGRKKKGDLQVVVSVSLKREVGKHVDLVDSSDDEVEGGYDSESRYFFGAFPNRGVG